MTTPWLGNSSPDCRINPGTQQSRSAGDLNLLRNINEHAVLSHIRARGLARVAEIATGTGLARTSVAEVLKALSDKGWVAAEAPMAAERGRPALRYRFRAEAGRIVGLDIGAHIVRAAIADLTGTVLANAERPVTPELTRRRRLNAAIAVVDQCLRSSDTAREDVWINVVGSTGKLAPDGRVLLASAIPNWAGLDLQAALAAKLPGGRVLVESDIRLVTMAEQRLGAARGVNDVIQVQAGRRSGFGIVLDGKPRRGHSGLAGDLSPYSAVNCDSAYRHIDECDACPSAGPSSDRGADVLAAAREGDERAIAAVRAYTRALAEVTAMASAFIDPELVVLGGILATQPDLVRHEFEAALRERCLEAPRVAISEFGRDAVSLGAIFHGLEVIGHDLLPDDHATIPPLRAPALHSR